MNEEQFEKAMDIIRERADKIYLFEGDKKPILYISSKESNINTNYLIKQFKEYLEDRIDLLLTTGYSIEIGTKIIKKDDENDDIELEIWQEKNYILNIIILQPV